jgi:hypothetical protein
MPTYYIPVLLTLKLLKIQLVKFVIDPKPTWLCLLDFYYDVDIRYITKMLEPIG